MPRNLLLVSSSKCHPHGYLDHCASQAAELFAGVKEIIFVPYARPGGMTHDEYTTVARDRFKKMDIDVRGLHEFDNPVLACLLYTSPSPRDLSTSRMPSSA